MNVLIKKALKPLILFLSMLAFVGISGYVLFTFYPSVVSNSFSKVRSLFGAATPVFLTTRTQQQIHQSVLAATQSSVLSGTVLFNIPVVFNDTAAFKNGITIAGGLNLNGTVLFNGKSVNLSQPTYTSGAGISVGAGGTANISNLGVLSFQGQSGSVQLTAGDGITIDGLTIKNTGVTSVDGQTGSVSFTGGTGIGVSGTTITNTDPGSSQHIFKNVTVGTSTIVAGTNTDTLSLAAGSGIALSTSGTTITVSSSIAGTTQYWQNTAGVLAPLVISNDIALGGISTASAKALFSGTTGTITTQGSLSVAGATNLASLSTSGNITNSGSETIAGTLGVTGLTTLTSLTTSGNITAGGLLTVTGASTLAGVTSSSLTTTGNTVVGTNATNTLAINALLTTDLIPSSSSVNLGSGAKPYGSIYALNLIPSSPNGQIGYWSQGFGTLSPAQITDDLVIGGNSTASAKFQTSGTTGNTSVGGTLGVTGSTTLATLAAGNTTTTGNDTISGTLGVTGTTALSSLTTSGNITSSGNQTISGTLGVTGNTTVSNIAASGNETVGGTLGVIGLTSLAGLSTSGNITDSGTLAVTGATTVGGTLGVTGLTSLTSLDTSGTIIDSGNLSVTGTSTLTGNSTVGGTFGVTGNTTLSTLTTSGNITSSGNQTIAGTLGVTGNTTLSTVSVSGVSSLATLNTTGTITDSGNLSVTGTSTLSGNSTVGGTLGVTGLTTLTGNLVANGNVTLGVDTTKTITTNGLFASSLIPLTSAVNLGSLTNPYGSLYVNNIIPTPGGGQSGYLQLGNGVLSPSYITNDLAIGGVSTASAKFQVSGTTGNTSVGGTFAVTGVSTLTGNTTVGGTLGVTGLTSLAGLTTSGNIADNGTLSVTGTTALAGTLSANGNVVLGTNGSNTITPNGVLASSLLPQSSSINLGSAGSPYGTVYATSFLTSGNGTAGFWQLAAGALSPTNITNDLIIGSIATSGAKFQTSGTTGNTIIGGTLAVTGASTLTGNTTVGGTLGVTGLTSIAGLTTSGNIVDSGTLAVTGISTLTGNTTVGGTLGVTGNTTLSTLSTSGTITNGGSQTIAGTLGVTGATTLAGATATSFNNSGNTTLGTNATNTITPNGLFNLSLIPSLGGTINLGSTTNPYGTLFVNNTVTTAQSGQNGFWQLALGALSPANTTNDLVIGSTATSGAKFQTSGTTGNTSMAGTLSVSGTSTLTGNTTVGGTLGVTGTTTMSVASITGNSTIGGTLGVTGNTALSALSTSGNITNSGNQTIAGTLGVTGLTSLVNLNTSGNIADSGTLAVTGTSTLTGNTSVGGTFGVTGATSLTSLAVSTNQTIAGTLGVTGATTVGVLSATGNTTLGTNATNTITANGLLATSLVPTSGGTINLGSGTNAYGTVYANNLITTAQSGQNGFWQLGSGVLAPINSTNDLAIGGISTTSAKFQVSGANGSATTAGSITFTNAANAVLGTAVKGAWTLNGNTFTFRRTITITNNSSTQAIPIGTQVTLTPTSTILADICAKTQASGNDIRIAFNSTELTSNLTDSCASSLSVAFKLQATLPISTATSTYYLYYSNATLGTGGTTYTYANSQIDSMDSAASWTSSDNVNLVLSQENSIKQEGTGSLKAVQTAISPPAANVGTWSTNSQSQLPQTLRLQTTVSATITGSTYLYLIGGYSGASLVSTVYKAQVDTNGNVGAWSTSGQGQLPIVIFYHTTVSATIAGTTYLYMIGSSVYLPTVYRAQVDPSGNVGAWSTTSQGQLPQKLNSHTTVPVTIAGITYLYTIGGNNGGAVNVVYRAQIDGSGNVGAWSTASQTQFPIAIYNHTTAPVTIAGTTYLYTVGGFNGLANISAVYKAQLDTSGNVGAWSTTSQGQLPQLLVNHTTVPVTVNGTTYLYTIGGLNGPAQSTVYMAQVNASGNVGAWSTTSQGQLPQILDTHTTIPVTLSGTTYLYTIGGFDGSATLFSTVYRAQVLQTTAADTATRTIASKDLTNYGGIQFQVYSSRTGTYMNLEFSNDGGTTWQSYPFNVTTPNTWQVVTVNTSGLIGSQKNTVTKVRFNVTDATTGFTAYFDDLEAVPSAYTDLAPTLAAAGATFGSSNLALNSQGTTGVLNLNYDPANSQAGGGGMALYNGASTQLFGVDGSGNIALGQQTATPQPLTIAGAAASGSNVAGANITFDASNGTGTGGSGNFIFRTATSSSAPAILLDSSATNTDCSGTSACTIAYTTGSQTNRFLVVGVNIYPGNGTAAISSMTYGGVALTNAAALENNVGFNGLRHEVWYMKAPTTGANNLVINTNIGAYLTVNMATYYNVNQTTPVGSVSTNMATSSTSIATAPSTSVGQLLIDSVSYEVSAAMNYGAGQAVVWGNMANPVGTFYGLSGSSQIASSSATTMMSWSYGSTVTGWTQIALPINQLAIITSSTAANTLAPNFQITANGNVVAGSGNLTTSSTDGFLYVASTSGRPTGIPTSYAGTAPLTVDTVNNKLCMYDTSWLCSAALTDYAEWAPAKGASSGDIVELTTLLNPVADETAPFMLGKSATPYSSKMIGVVSKYAEDANSANGYKRSDDYHAIALTGRVPVKVSTMNGPIQIGDYLTSSSIPGVAMKATRAGMVIGKSTQDYTASDSASIGSVITFIQPTVMLPTIQLTDTGNLSNADLFATSVPMTTTPVDGVLGQAKDDMTSVATSSGSVILKQVQDDVAGLRDQVASLSASVVLAKARTSSSTTSADLQGQIDTLSKAVNLLMSSQLNGNPLAGSISSSSADTTTLTNALTVTEKTTLGNVGITGTIQAGLLTIDGLNGTMNTLAGDLKLQATGLNGIDLENGKVMIDTLGNIVSKGELTVKKLTIDVSDPLSSTTGDATLSAGKTEVIVTTTALTDQSKVFITPNIPTLYGVIKKIVGHSFTIQIDKPNLKDILFNWWIVN